MKNIYVGNLPFSTTEAALKQAFEAYGQVTRANVVMDRETGQPRGFGFIEMANEAEGNAAIEALNGAEMDGRSLTVNEARARESRGGGGGRSGGGRGGDRGRDRY